MKVKIYCQPSYEEIDPRERGKLGGEPYLNYYIITPQVDDEVVAQVCEHVFWSKTGPATEIRGMVIDQVQGTFL